MLGSFIGGTSTYTLARLEYALWFSTLPAPPVLDRLPDASERTLREHWDRIQTQLHQIVGYVAQIDLPASDTPASTASLRSLQRTVRELDQYARALRWVMTFTDRDATAEPPPEGRPGG